MRWLNRRELRIKLNEYRGKIDGKRLNKREEEITKFHYDTLLFNYYEYLAVCLKKELINESETWLYFKEFLIELKENFDESVLFKKRIGDKEKYPGIQWLFKNWKL